MPRREEAGSSCQRKAATGFWGERWMASSRWGVEGAEVMVKPPGEGMEGAWRSSHWPGRNCERGFRRYEGGAVGGTNVYGGVVGGGEVEDADGGGELVDVGDGCFVEGLVGVSVRRGVLGWG